MRNGKKPNQEFGVGYWVEWALDFKRRLF